MFKEDLRRQYCECWGRHPVQCNKDFPFTLQWRHNERDGVSNHRRLHWFLTVGSGGDRRKHQSSASLAFVRGLHRWPMNSPKKRPVTRKMFPFDDVIVRISIASGRGVWCSSLIKFWWHIYTSMNWVIIGSGKCFNKLRKWIKVQKFIMKQMNTGNGICKNRTDSKSDSLPRHGSRMYEILCGWDRNI